MKLNVKEYFKLAIIYTVIAALPPMLQLITQPFIVGKGRLNAVDFSYLAITEIITTFVFVVTAYSMGVAISRFYYDHIEDKKGYNKLVSGVFNSIIIRGIGLLLLAVVFGKYIGQFFSQKELQDFPSYGYASIILGVSRALCITAFGLYRNEKKVGKFIVFNVALGILRTACQLIGLFYYKMTFIGYVYGGCIGSSIVSISILAYTYYYSGIHIDFKFLKPINNFARPLFIYALLGWGLTYTGRFFLQDYPKELGIYYTAINFAIGIQLIIQGMQGASQPEAFRFMTFGISEHQEEIRRLGNLLMVQVQTLIGILIIPTMLFLTFFYKSDVKIASTFICIIFFDFILKSQTYVFALPIYYLKKTNFLFMINTISLIVTLIFNYLFAHILKANGLIAATIIGDLLLTIGTYYYQRKIVHIEWNMEKVMIYPLIMMFIAIAAEIFKNIFHIGQYLSASIVVITMFAGIFILYRNEFKGLVNKYVR